MSRIVNGRFAHHRSYPFLASISYNSYRMMDSKAFRICSFKLLRTLNFFNDSKTFLPFEILPTKKEPLRHLLPDSLKLSGLTCTGTIINERWILTAAVCLTSNLNALTIGLPNSNDLVKMFDEDHIPIKRVIVHPKFNATMQAKAAHKDFAYNLALIELTSPIRFGNTISPACLAVAAKNHKKVYHEPLISAGYGAIVNQIDNFKSRLLKEIDLVDRSADTVECLDNAKLMCLRSADKRDVLAINDLGGGVLATADGRSYVVSVLSNIEIAIDDESETAYFTDLSFAARLVESIDWIQEYVQDDYCSDE